jgi:Transcriptional regulators of sugar metabolism
MAAGVGRSSDQSVRARRRQVVDLVTAAGAISVEDIASQTGVSSVTIYRDLWALEKSGQLTRSQRGLVSLASPDRIGDSKALSEPNQYGRDKAAIADTAIKRIPSGSTVLMDCSDAAVEISRMLPDQELTVITDSLAIAKELKRAPSIRLLLTGGEYHAASDSLVGKAAIDMVASLRADYSLVGVTGISANGCFHPVEAVSEVRQAMIASANTPVLLVDHTDWAVTALHRFGSLSDFAEAIVDPDTTADQLAILREALATVTVAEKPVCPYCAGLSFRLYRDGVWRLVYEGDGKSPRGELTAAEGREFFLTGGAKTVCPHCGEIIRGYRGARQPSASARLIPTQGS